MKLRVIKTKKEYDAALDWVDKMFDRKVTADSKVGEDLQVVLLLIKQYEDARYPIPIPMPTPIAAIKAKMEEKGLRNKDLVGKIGTKGYISALLNNKKPLTLEIVKIFYRELGIPAEVLLS
jgi:HTH-type transcriptional regulator / antitoxin HigA